MTLNLNTKILGPTRKVANVNADGSLDVNIVDMPAITVDPPVGGATEAKQDAGNALLTTIDADTGTLAGAVVAGKVQAEVVNTPNVAVTSSALPSGAATSAKQDTANTSLATLAGAVAGLEMQVDVVSMPITVVNIPTGGGATPITVGINISSIDTHEIVAADATKRIKVLNYKIKAHGANTVTIKHGSTAFGGPNTMADGEYDGIAGSILGPVLITGVNEALNITTTSTAQLSGHLTYILE